MGGSNSEARSDAAPPGTVFDHWYLADGSGEITCPPGFTSGLCDYDVVGFPSPFAVSEGGWLLRALSGLR